MRIEGALIMEISYRLIDLVRKPVTGALRRFSVAYLYLPLKRLTCPLWARFSRHLFSNCTRLNLARPLQIGDNHTSW